MAAALLGQGQGQSSDAARAGDPGEDGGWSLDAVPPGSTAAVALVEHIWAEPLTAALERAGGRPLEETWLGPDDRGALEALVASAAPRSGNRRRSAAWIGHCTATSHVALAASMPIATPPATSTGQCAPM